MPDFIVPKMVTGGLSPEDQREVDLQPGGTVQVRYQTLEVTAPRQDLMEAVEYLKEMSPTSRRRTMANVVKTIESIRRKMDKGSVPPRKAINVGIWFANEVVEGREVFPG